MKNPGDRLYLLHIEERIQRIERCIGEGRDAFMDSEMAQDAVIRNFEVIGEATKQVSPPLRERFPDIAWRQMAGFRDVLIHNYMGIDLEEVWNTVTNDLPVLKEQIQEALRSLEP